MTRERSSPWIGGNLVGVAIVLSVLLLAGPFVSGAAASAASNQQGGDDCDEPGYDMECSKLGSIRMPSTQAIEGEPEAITASIWLNSDMEEENARWWLFKVDSEHGQDVVHATVNAFSTEDGTVLTTRESTDHPVEQEFWVDIADLPVQQEITIDMTVGSTEVGAYEVEVHVIPFDRGYENLYDENGETYGLYASTTLSVTEATDPFGGGDQAAWISLLREAPGPGAYLAVAAIVLAGLAAKTRRPG